LLIDQFNNGKFNLLIASNVIARGYDNREVGLVI